MLSPFFRLTQISDFLYFYVGTLVHLRLILLYTSIFLYHLRSVMIQTLLDYSY